MPSMRPVAVALLLAACVWPLTADQGASVDIDTRGMFRDLQQLSADDMEGRAVDTPGAARARALLLDRFRAVGLRPVGASYERTFGTAPRGVNLIGQVPGTRTPDRFIVVSAHYDHVGTRDGRTFNGANDNASGAAALAVIGEYFVRHQPATSILFVAFDGEERGLLGSRAFVKNPPVEASALLVNVNLDMIGRDPNNRLFVSGTRQFPVLRPFVAAVAGDALVDLRMGYDDPRGGRDDWTRDSDQWAFMEAGIPAVYVGVEDFALHHHPDDDYESMTLPFYERAVKTIVRMIEAFDRGADDIAASRR